MEFFPIRTGLTHEEFSRVYKLLEEKGESLKRGRKLLDLDVRFVILLEWLHHGQTFQALGNSMGLEHSRVQTCIGSIWSPLADTLFEAYILKRSTNYIPKRLFINYPEAIGALYTTLFSIFKPSNAEENRAMYSGKHREHGMSQVFSASDGTCIRYGGVIEGSRNDFWLYKCSGLARAMKCQETDTDGIPISIKPQILVDSGYQGIKKAYSEAITYYRKPIQDQKNVNREISQDRVVVERFFGRLKSY